MICDESCEKAMEVVASVQVVASDDAGLGSDK